MGISINSRYTALNSTYHSSSADQSQGNRVIFKHLNQIPYTYARAGRKFRLSSMALSTLVAPAYCRSLLRTHLLPLLLGLKVHWLAFHFSTCPSSFLFTVCCSCRFYSLESYSPGAMWSTPFHPSCLCLNIIQGQHGVLWLSHCLPCRHPISKC